MGMSLDEFEEQVPHSYACHVYLCKIPFVKSVLQVFAGFAILASDMF